MISRARWCAGSGSSGSRVDSPAPRPDSNTGSNPVGATASSECIAADELIDAQCAAELVAAFPAGSCGLQGSMTSEERASPENGTWLCQTPDKLIDNDEMLSSVQN